MNRASLERQLSLRGFTENRDVWTSSDGDRFVMLTEGGVDDNRAVYGSAIAEEAGESMTYFQVAQRAYAQEERPKFFPPGSTERTRGWSDNELMINVFGNETPGTGPETDEEDDDGS